MILSNYFANLTTMIKLHLDDFRTKKYDRNAMIWFYQNWFLNDNDENLSIYAEIKISDFSFKRNRRLTIKRKKFVFRNTTFEQSATKTNDEKKKTFIENVWWKILDDSTTLWTLTMTLILAMIFSSWNLHMFWLIALSNHIRILTLTSFSCILFTGK